MLTLKSLFFTILIPGTVAGLIPYLIVSRTVVRPNTGLQVLGLGIIAAGAAILGWCVRDFATKGRGTLAPVDPPKQLVVQGLYRYVRNPMYLGVLLLLLGQTTFFQSLVLLQYAIVWFVIVNLIVLFYEEPALRRRFGESYDRYYHSVHRWLPSRPTSGGE
jgi:protein-S-isoprenylcysteine O-methyltransferase Ste14